MTTKSTPVAETTPLKSYKVYTPAPRIDTDNLPILNTDDLPPTALMQTLGKALTMKRDAGSMTEASFVAWLVNRLPVTMIDEAGNIHVDLTTDPTHRTMFTAHTDTVHSSGGVNTVRVDGKFWRADKGSCLGADDGAGVALLAHLIERQVPGYYVFFRSEECGGIGSKWLAQNMKALFSGFDRAVAFDRAGYADVITHQGFGRCASDAFAEALAAQLSTDTNWFLPDDTGVYTDTAEFVRLVPECTNVSVGYKRQHGDNEWQDVEFLTALAAQLVQVKWDELPTKRDPKAYESKYSGQYSGASYGKYGGVYMGSSFKGKDDDLDLTGDKWPEGYWADTKADEKTPDTGYDDPELESVWDALEDAIWGSFGDLLDLIAIAAFPDEPELALRSLSRAKLTQNVLNEAQNNLADGMDADALLLDLFDIAYVI